MTQGAAQGDRVRRQIETWRDELLDLSGRNRLLKFKHSRASSFEVTQPTAKQMVSRLQAPRTKELSIFIPSDPEPGDGLTEIGFTHDVTAPSVVRPANDDVVTQKKTGVEVRRTCATLARRASQEFMDRGIWVLYVAVGMLSWKDPADTRAELQDSPLLLLPVELKPAQGAAAWRIAPSGDDAVVNSTLWMKLERDFGLALPAPADLEAVDLDVFLDGIREAVAGHSEWRVEARTVLTYFSFHKEAMYADLRDNVELIEVHDLVSALADDVRVDRHAGLAFDPVPERKLDEIHPPERAHTILDADSSQRQCIAAALEGRSFAMDGPPGTGKSQTIANMIAELIAANKTVLFVSEKAAALDVVRNRLADRGLEDYVLELHSHKATRASVAKSLGQSLSHRPKPMPRLTTGDLDEATINRQMLSGYAAALNEPLDELDGHSLHWLLGRVAKLQGVPQAPIAAPDLDAPSSPESVRSAAEKLRSTWEVAESGDAFVWRAAVRSHWSASADQQVAAILQEALDALQELEDLSGAVAESLRYPIPRGAQAVGKLIKLAELVEERPDGVEVIWLASDRFKTIKAAAEHHIGWLRNRAAAATRTEERLGPNTAQLDAKKLGPAIKTSMAAIAGFDSASMRAEDLQRLQTDLSGTADRLHELKDAYRTVAGLLGLRLGDWTVEVAADAAAATRLLLDPVDAPPSAWLTRAAGLADARTSWAEIRAAVADERSAREEASAFSEGALELDLTELQNRFSTVHKGFRKWGAAYKIDRSLIEAVVSIPPKEGIAALPLAIRWKTMREQVDQAATKHGRLLDAVWEGVGTDLDSVDARLSSAQVFNERIGDHVSNWGRLADTAARVRAGGEPVTEAVAASERLEAAIAALRRDSPERAMALVGDSVEQAASTLRTSADAVSQLADEVVQVEEHTRAGLTVAELQIGLADCERVRDLDAELNGRQGPLKWLGPIHGVPRADPDALETAFKWATKMRQEAPFHPTESVAERWAVAAVEAGPLNRAATRWTQAQRALLAEFEESRHSDLGDQLISDFDDARDLVTLLLAQRAQIELWIDFTAAWGRLESLGLGRAAEFCEARPVGADHLVSVLQRSYFEGLADLLIERRSDDLGPLRSTERDRMVREFVDRDRAVVHDAPNRVMQAGNARRPSALIGMAKIIEVEANKKRRHMPVSQLLNETSTVAQNLKPCFMMSPLSVSQFLSPEMAFDVVIFDEASQVRPNEAIGALYRGRSMVIAGDEKQLPPTDFFSGGSDSDDDEWSEDQLHDFDSLLTLSKGAGAFPSLSLRWHYRSRHESLIAFSNLQFYAGDMITFPSATERSESLGLEFFPVPDGIYRRGTSRDNPVEAQLVVDRIFRHAERGGDSVGVVAFSEAQASCIEALLLKDPRYEEYHDRLRPNDRLAGLFVKNLENVQGDERDIIIFSTGYGRDETGKFLKNFGPVGKGGGWRRLNVAITRARKRVEIACSFDPGELAGTNNENIRHLRRYLEYARDGYVALYGPDGGQTDGETDSPFEDAVLETIRKWGYDVTPQVGTAGYRIDLGVRHPDKPGTFCLGVECDGAMYHSSSVARDRDRLRQQVLEGLGWTFHRIWGPAWYRDRSGEERALKRAIEQSLVAREAPPSEAHELPPVRDVPEVEVVDFSGPPPWASTYGVAALPPVYSREPDDASAQRVLRDLVRLTVDQEGPIVDDLLERRVIKCWDVSVTERRRKPVQAVIRQLLAERVLTRDGDALQLEGRVTTTVRVPDVADPETARPVKHLPSAELAQAVLHFVHEAQAVTEEEALQRVARLFGWARRGSAIQAAMTEVLDGLLRSGRIQRRGHELVPSARQWEEHASG